ncbi:MAG TPA: hypothetical protein VEF03_05265, partial [Candidatus Binataceae bacterium]|nr:hypothetical protein [Candidatus Binataceae bacterium]
MVGVHHLVEIVREAASLRGLNLVAAIPISRYDDTVKPASRAAAIASNSRSIIVIASGGGAFWNSFKDHINRHSEWARRQHPLDDFTRGVVENEIAPALAREGVVAKAVYPFMNGGATLNFMELGKIAGICGPSILGVMVNPIYGPWLAFRAALLIDREIDEPGDAVGFDPCPRCEARSCITACPASAVHSDSGWNISRCLVHRVEHESDCASLCHARVACVLGPEHRYPADELE